MNQAARDAMVEEAAALYGQASRLMDPVRLRIWEEQGITFPQLRILFRLRANSGIDLRTLADGLGISPSAASQQVDKLVERGFIYRSEDPHDRRRLRLQLTPHAEESLGEYSRIAVAYCMSIVSKLTDTDLKELSRLLRVLTELNAPPPPLPSRAANPVI